MKVVELFTSIEGEGVRAGRLCTFIRLAGCNLNCTYCDTKQAQDFNVGTDMTAEEIVAQVDSISLSDLVTLTGGEPLSRCRKDVLELLELLYLKGYQVNIETNGSVDVLPFRAFTNTFFTVDYKSPSSGCEGAMVVPMFYKLRSRDVVKFVVGSIEDLETAVRVCSNDRIRAVVYVSPVFGQIEPVEIVEFMKQHPICSDWRLQIQLHKVVWDPNMKGV